MINKEQATEIVEKYINKYKKIFKLPKYGLFKSIPYYILLAYKKIKFRKLYPDDYEHIATILPTDNFYVVEEDLFVRRCEEYNSLFVFYLGTPIYNVEGRRYWGMMHIEERPIVVDRRNGKIYRFIVPFPGIEHFIDLFLHHEEEEGKLEEFKGTFKKLDIGESGVPPQK